MHYVKLKAGIEIFLVTFLPWRFVPLSYTALIYEFTLEAEAYQYFDYAAWNTKKLDW